MIYKPNILLCCSSASFILTSLYGYKKQKYMYPFEKNTNGKMRYLMWFNVGGVVTCFTLSCITSRIKYKDWHHFHFLFHMFVIGTKMLAYNTNLLL